MDPYSAFKAGKAITTAARWLERFSNNARFKETSEKIHREWVSDLAEAFRALEERVGQLELEKDAEEKEAMYVGAVALFTPVAVGALSPDRRRLLAVAAANVLRPDLDVETKSRVVRVIQMLEPGDVIHLRELETIGLSLTASIGYARDRSSMNWLNDPHTARTRLSEDVLRAQLCLDDRSNSLSDLGRAVLHFLQDWQPVSSA